ncbi:unnamed protein product, partial [Ilex paraguariensis]
MSSVVEFASKESSDHEDGNERLDLLHTTNPTAANLSLPAETFLKAAISVKDQ